MDPALTTEQGFENARQQRLGREADLRADKAIAFQKAKEKKATPKEVPSKPAVVLKMPKPVAEAATQTDDSAKRKARAVVKVQAYARLFPEIRVKVPSQSADADAWEWALEEFRGILRSVDAPATVKSRIAYLGQGLVHLSRTHPEWVPLQLSGPAVDLNAVLASEQFGQAIDQEAKELAAEYAWFFSSSPLMRSAEKIVGAVLAVDHANKSILQSQSAPGSFPTQPPQQP